MDEVQIIFVTITAIVLGIAIALLVLNIISYKKFAKEYKQSLADAKRKYDDISFAIEGEIERRIDCAEEKYFRLGLCDKGRLYYLVGESFLNGGYKDVAIRCLVESANAFGTETATHLYGRSGEEVISEGRNEDANAVIKLLEDISKTDNKELKPIFSKDETIIYEGTINLIASGDEWAAIWPLIKSLEKEE